MCHPEPAPGPKVDGASLSDVEVPLATGESMPAVLAAPKAGSGPPVLLVADMLGPSEFYRALAARLADAGFEALLVDYFFRLAPLTDLTHEAGFARRRDLDEVATLDDLRGALAWLRQASDYKGAVGVIGFCMGGTFAFDLAALESDLVTVAYYGFPVPQAQLAAPPPAPMDLVPEIQGPVLAHWGDQDETVGLDHIHDFVRRMHAAGKDFAYHLYPGLGHGFLAQATFSGTSDGPANASWAATLYHLRQGLSGAAS